MSKIGDCVLFNRMTRWILGMVIGTLLRILTSKVTTFHEPQKFIDIYLENKLKFFHQNRTCGLFFVSHF